MSNSQEQSLNENVVFLPVDESSPEFLHCEREREAVERLLSSGPEAFYSSVGTERSGCFLSSEEVSQITSWAQNYEFNGLQQENSVGCSSAVHEDFCSTYFPGHTDVPAPNLELGWPVKSPWVPQGSVTVHTSPPADGEPPVREVIRRHLQKACQVIAIVTDRLTDGAIIWDLHNAASRGVPVYIILNQRSIQETVTLNRLRHPNMQVRVLGGTSFCSRAGRMVVGEMKNKFLLVDLETVIHGSYSLTWTDAHLHRQLITVLSGPVVDTFDKEFRILFAASLPVPNTWRVAANNAHVPHHLKDFPPLQFHKQVPLEPEIFSPPSPPADFLMDWEAMGVIQRDCSLPGSSLDQHEETMDKEPPLQNNVLFDKNTAIMDRFTKNGNQLVDKKRIWENTSPAIPGPPDESTVFNNMEPLSTDRAAAERMKRMEHKIEKALVRQLSMEKERHDRNATRLDGEAAEHVLLSAKKGERSRRRESILEEESITEEHISTVENTPSSRKPVILRVPQSESFSSLSDIMKRLKRGTSTGSNSTLSERTQSMMNLSAHNTDPSPDEKGVPVPRFKASVSVQLVVFL
ncbi:uncharacterized protein fam83e [Stegastes partitus]|uniref:Uncharacterized protein fam83e n=1 Tax=Stegastes partitus TaxID=144197 RepID=A0A9Y4KEJ4_9TELE|nr:PREDICTED: uncharacterized protein LOC103363019 [Stegastes partitus]